MGVTEQKTSLETYLMWLKEDGLIVSPNSSLKGFCWVLDHAIRDYGLDEVRKEILPLAPEIVEATHKRGVKVWTGDSVFERNERGGYESFYKAYNEGKTIYIGPITVKKN